jgi:hypothetical protein
MKRLSLAVALLVGCALPAAAECYADYKAKQDDPLRLHYGVAEVAACDPGGAEAELSPRLAADGWTLLNVLSTFGPEGLEERKDSAGAYFLRY